MNKIERHLAIKQVISHRQIGTQEDLCRALRQAGFDVTQATLSRDLKELSIARVNTPDGTHYVLSPETEERRLQAYLAMEIESIDHNESLVVIKTLPGRAQGVAEIIDGMHHPNILGTIAGDNTIFVTPRSVRKLQSLLKELRDLAVRGRERIAGTVGNA